MTHLYPIIFSILFSILCYFIKSIHSEIKQLLKELTEYTQELRTLISNIQIQIDKGIEADITEIKTDIKYLYKKSNTNAAAIARYTSDKRKNTSND
ncbi:hypothetical protein ACFSTE_05850 [Aquimarina hainanensis]|uniref:Uncharacterized protein n=1 Tax=Aquimarina hainanensis TaxID=1578017 RepID=A0ABW5N408_9FLAO